MTAKNTAAARDVAADLIGDNDGKPSKKTAAPAVTKSAKPTKTKVAKAKAKAKADKAKPNKVQAKGKAATASRAQFTDTQKIVIKKERAARKDSLCGKKWGLLKSGMTVGDWRKKCAAAKLPGTGFPLLSGLVRGGFVAVK